MVYFINYILTNIEVHFIGVFSIYYGFD